MYLIFFLITNFISIVLNAENFRISDESFDALKKLKEILENPPRKAWSYSNRYKTLTDMLIVTNVVNKAIVNDGYLSKRSIQRQLLKALQGQNVNAFIFGESVSVGAGLGPSNQNKTYHYALAHWWNNTIGKITGSNMVRRVIAVGGVSSSYFSRCWKEYIKNNDEIDVGLWEFNVNDAKETNLKKTIEIFTRSILKKTQRLDLLFAIFYRSNYFDVTELRHEISENIVLQNAEYYNLTCFNIEEYMNHTRFNVDEEDMFATDNLHPSHLAHAQMALIIVRYYINTIYEFIIDIIDKNMRFYTFETQVFPPPKYLIRDVYETICWNAVLPSVVEANQNNHLLFSLKNNHTSDFQIQLAAMSVPEERSDVTGGYKTDVPGGKLTITFDAVSTYGLCDIAVALRYSDPDSITEITLSSTNGKQAVRKIINAKDRQNALYVDYISTVAPGRWTLGFSPLKGGMLLSAILAC